MSILLSLCPNCPANLEARARFSDTFWVDAAQAVLPFAAIALAAILVVRFTRVPLSGLVLGIGLGGFFDGILLHQILQWHSMLSSVAPPNDLVTMKYNMVWDGLFHAGTWAVTLLGIVLMFRAGKRADAPWSGRVLAGAMLAGWGLFNFIEGLIDHQLLGLHHVHPGENQLAWDLGFVVVGGVGLMLVGYLLTRTRPSLRRSPRHAPHESDELLAVGPNALQARH